MPALPTGIVPIVQTPFSDAGQVDARSFERLIEDAIGSGAGGLVFPAVASEVSALTAQERSDLLQRLIACASGNVPVIAGVSSESTDETRALARHAEKAGADALLIQPVESARVSAETLTAYLRGVTRETDLPILVQDLDWNGPGMDLDTIVRTAQAVSALAGIKVETVPAGPKYTAIREATAGRLHVSGGWAVTQMIDGLRRGLDAFMPEASMVRIYRAVWDTFHQGDEPAARALFDRLAPVLLFSNQHIDVSIQFFKRVLRRRGIFATTACRGIRHELDAIQAEQADRLAATAVQILASMPP